MNINLSKEILKHQAKVMRDFLAKNSVTLSQSSAYNLLSMMYGFDNWNSLSALLKKEET